MIESLVGILIKAEDWLGSGSMQIFSQDPDPALNLEFCRALDAATLARAAATQGATLRVLNLNAAHGCTAAVAAALAQCDKWQTVR